ncbi:hypothetical protein NM208_g5429 [Fusarium decemcellulare]|uniref:Uncharacterized protein n=1 Tax=Fusarium decemcellulare TaxID=57161 RepID=A0ACC1SGZ6_9HYPO|nr:hypothetical protein NM208_g5429 [Fusarium decemcellulare]
MAAASSPEHDGEERWPKTWSTNGVFRSWAKNHLSRWLGEVEGGDLGGFGAFNEHVEAHDEDVDMSETSLCASRDDTAESEDDDADGDVKSFASDDIEKNHIPIIRLWPAEPRGKDLAL